MTTANGKKIADLVRTIRIESELRQQDVADRMGVPQSFVSKSESGERRLDVLELKAFCDACGVDLVEFVERLLRTLADDHEN